MDIDYLRQLAVFNPKNFEKKSVTVVGAGATGSCVALMLAQMGIKNLTVWDHDEVEEHNLPNQMFFLSHIGKPKVEALKEVVKLKCGFDIETHKEKVVDQKITSNYIFILTDTMSSRKEIFQNCIKGKSFNTDLVIETRMDADNGRIYAFNPNSPSHVKEWEATLYEDKEASESVCGASISIIPTVSALASMAVWKLIHHFDVEYGPNNTKKNNKEEELHNECIFQLGPEDILTRRFKSL